MKTKLIKFIITIVLVFTSASCSNDSKENLPQNLTLITNYNSSNYEVELARLINQYRLTVGKNKLEIVNHIYYKSQEHNFHMIENNFVNHVFF